MQHEPAAEANISAEVEDKGCIFTRAVSDPGGNISQNFSEIIFDFLIFQFSEKF